MTYSQVRFIGFSQKTVPGNTQWLEGEGGAFLLEGAYGENHTLEKDISGRCRLLQNAIESAREFVEGDGDNAAEDENPVLNVFLAPEFFFRNHKNEYLSGSEDEGLERLRKRLAWMVRAKKWRHWLFVFGTALTAREHARGGNPEYLNVALVQRGGEEEKGTFAVATALDRVKDDAKNNHRDYDRDAMVEKSGVMIGLDLAVDHRDRARRTGLPPVLPGLPLPRIILTPSCGAAPASSGNQDLGAWWFQCDGRSGKCRLITPEGRAFRKGPEKKLEIDPGSVPLEKLFTQGEAGKVWCFPLVELPEPALGEGALKHYAFRTADRAYTLAIDVFFDTSGRMVDSAVALEDNGSGQDSGYFRLPCTIQVPDAAPPLTAQFAPAKTASVNGGLHLNVDIAYPPSPVKGVLQVTQSRFQTLQSV